jgi:enterochelin esterase family protein
VDGIELRQTEIVSAVLGNTRTVWLQPPTGEPAGTLVFLDAEYYVAHVKAAPIVARLEREGAIPPLLAAYVSHIDFKIRWPETFMNPAFAEFLETELLPWLGVDGEATVAGLSLTGLAAAHAAIVRPGAFTRALCQSGSFWWEDGRMIDEVARLPRADVRFRVSVGAAETDEEVDHGDGLVQHESQLDSNRRMRDALVARGYAVSYAEFEGGHGVAAWRDDLPAGLTSLFEPDH